MPVEHRAERQRRYSRQWNHGSHSQGLLHCEAGRGRYRAGCKRRNPMLYWAVVFLVVAIIAGLFQFGGMASASASIAQILFFIFLVLLVLSLDHVLRTRTATPAADLTTRPLQLTPSEAGSEIKATVWQRWSDRFPREDKEASQWNPLSQRGRAPHLHPLCWLAIQNEWRLSPDAVRGHPGMCGSVGQVVEEGYLKDLIDNDPDIAQAVHLEDLSEMLTIEDLHCIFYMCNISPQLFCCETSGFTSAQFSHKYDFALLFAGEEPA